MSISEQTERAIMARVGMASRQLLFEVGNAQIIYMRRRLAKSIGVDDRAMPALTDRYAKRKGSVKRDMLLTGRMLGSLRVEVDERELTATIGFTDETSLQKARGNQARTPWFGFSPRDRAALNKLIQAFMKG